MMFHLHDRSLLLQFANLRSLSCKPTIPQNASIVGKSGTKCRFLARNAKKQFSEEFPSRNFLRICRGFSVLKQVAMRPRTLCDENEFFFLHAINEQPVRLDVAFTKLLLIARQLMIMASRRSASSFASASKISFNFCKGKPRFLMRLKSRLN